jgi:long-chain acyl-CoA synthetase
LDYAQLTARWAREVPDKPCFITEDKCYTYREVNHLADHYADTLRNAEVRQGTLLIIRRRPLDQITAFLGAERAGLVPVLGHPDMTDEMAENLAKARHIRWIDTGKVRPGAEENTDLTDVCMGVLSSGTTGMPKLMYRTYASWADFFPEQNRLFQSDRNTVAFVEGSMSFTGNLNVWACLLYSGATMVVAEGLHPRRWAKAMEKYAVNFVYLVPVKLKLFLRSVNAIFPKVKTVMAGSQLLDSATTKALKHCFPRSEIYLYYGASELDYITSLTYDELLAHPMSVGKPCKGVKVSVKDGLIYIDTPYHVKGLSQPCTLGDTGYWDEDGYLIFEGRRGQIINKGGLTISCTKVEEALLQLDIVSDAIVLAIRDERRGQDMAAFVILNRDASDAALRTALRRSLLPSELPKYFVRMKEFPLNGVGKLNTRALLDLLKKKR